MPEENADPQAFTAEDPGTETDEEAQPGQASGAGLLQGASGAERQAVLERLQGQDHPLAAGFKVSLCVFIYGLQDLRFRLQGQDHPLAAGFNVSLSAQCFPDHEMGTSLRFISGHGNSAGHPWRSCRACERLQGPDHPLAAGFIQLGGLLAY